MASDRGKLVFVVRSKRDRHRSAAQSAGCYEVMTITDGIMAFLLLLYRPCVPGIARHEPIRHESRIADGRHR